MRYTQPNLPLGHIETIPRKKESALVWWMREGHVGRPAVVTGTGRVKVACPFHREKSPSCVLTFSRNHPKRGRFKCYGCGAGGSILYLFNTLDKMRRSSSVRDLSDGGGSLAARSVTEDVWSFRDGFKTPKEWATLPEAYGGAGASEDPLPF